jgi:hypothetical protein
MGFKCLKKENRGMDKESLNNNFSILYLINLTKEH